MISPHILAELAMLRRAYRPVLPGNHTKRPVGGRPNPCALHREPRHPLALPTNLATNRRRIRSRVPTMAAWQMVSEAVQNGSLPVGVPIREGHIRRAIGRCVSFDVENLALRLAERRDPVRLRRINRNQWIASIR